MKKSNHEICASDILCGLYLLREDELIRHNLTKKETVVAQHMLNGEGTSRIAKRLHLSIPGVKYHVGNILSKTKKNTREEFCNLIRIGVERSERTWKSRKAMRDDAEGRIVPPSDLDSARKTV